MQERLEGVVLRFEIGVALLLISKLKGDTCGAHRGGGRIDAPDYDDDADNEFKLLRPTSQLLLEQLLV